MDTLFNTPKQVGFVLQHQGISPAEFSAAVAACTEDSQDQAPIRTWSVAPVKGANCSTQRWIDAQVAFGERVCSQAVGQAAPRCPTEPSLGGWTPTCRLLPTLPAAASPSLYIKRDFFFFTFIFSFSHVLANMQAEMVGYERTLHLMHRQALGII